MMKNVPSLQIAVADHSAIVKVNGRANFTTSVSFKHLVSELRQRGFQRFALDLTQCVTMDSTFLGVLAGTAVDLSETRQDVPGTDRRNTTEQGQLRLLNPSERVSDLLDNLGIAELFSPVFCQIPTAEDQNLAPAQEVSASREEITQTCLEAHRRLMDLNPENVPKFKDVAEFLAQDIANLKAQHSQPAAEEGSKSANEVKCSST